MPGVSSLHGPLERRTPPSGHRGAPPGAPEDRPPLPPRRLAAPRDDPRPRRAAEGEAPGRHARGARPGDPPGRDLRVARGLPQGVRRHARGAADRGGALPRRLRAREDCAAENVRYLEVRYSPMLHTRRGLKPTTIVDAVLEGLRAREARDRHQVARHRLRHPAHGPADLAAAGRARGRLQGRASSASTSPAPRTTTRPASTARRFQLILDNNVNCTIHAGEAYGPESIAQAIHYCGAHRIGHGVRLRENGDLLNYVNDHRIPLEMCPSSNVQTGVGGRVREPPAQVLLRLRPARDDQHRQPAHHRHHRHEGALHRAPGDGLHPRGPRARSSSRGSRARSSRSARSRTC